MLAIITEREDYGDVAKLFLDVTKSIHIIIWTRPGDEYWEVEELDEFEVTLTRKEM